MSSMKICKTFVKKPWLKSSLTYRPTSTIINQQPCWGRGQEGDGSVWSGVHRLVTARKSIWLILVDNCSPLYLRSASSSHECAMISCYIVGWSTHISVGFYGYKMIQTKTCDLYSDEGAGCTADCCLSISLFISLQSLQTDPLPVCSSWCYQAHRK